MLNKSQFTSELTCSMQFVDDLRLLDVICLLYTWISRLERHMWGNDSPRDTDETLTYILYRARHRLTLHGRSDWWHEALKQCCIRVDVHVNTMIECILDGSLSATLFNANWAIKHNELVYRTMVAWFNYSDFAYQWRTLQRTLVVDYWNMQMSNTVCSGLHAHIWYTILQHLADFVGLIIMQFQRLFYLFISLWTRARSMHTRIKTKSKCEIKANNHAGL